MFADFVKVGVGLRVEDKSGHSSGISTAVIFTLAPEVGESFLAVNGLYAAALEVIVAAVQILAQLSELLKISCHCILDEIAGCATRFGSQLVKAGLGFWPEVYFHT